MTIARPLAAACMAVVVAATVSIAPTGRGQTGPPSGRSGGISSAQARNEVDRITRDLREARTLAKQINDRATREKMELILGRAELRARDLSDELAKVRPAPSQPAPLTAAEFDKLLKGLRQEAFDEGKVTYIENFGGTRPLTCEQATALLKSFAFDQGRLKAVVVLYPKIVDKQNFNDVLNAFVFPSSRVDARKAVGLK